MLYLHEWVLAIAAEANVWSKDNLTQKYESMSKTNPEQLNEWQTINNNNMERETFMSEALL